ncbi:MAG: hypothetical protein Kow00107_01440 [Planctomycetota bacterium]
MFNCRAHDANGGSWPAASVILNDGTQFFVGGLTLVDEGIPVACFTISWGGQQFVRMAAVDPYGNARHNSVFLDEPPFEHQRLIDVENKFVKDDDFPRNVAASFISKLGNRFTASVHALSNDMLIQVLLGFDVRDSKGGANLGRHNFKSIQIPDCASLLSVVCMLEERDKGSTTIGWGSPSCFRAGYLVITITYIKTIEEVKTVTFRRFAYSQPMNYTD